MLHFLCRNRKTIRNHLSIAKSKNNIPHGFSIVNHISIEKVMNISEVPNDLAISVHRTAIFWLAYFVGVFCGAFYEVSLNKGCFRTFEGFGRF